MKTIEDWVEHPMECQTDEPCSRLAPDPHTHNTNSVNPDRNSLSPGDLFPDPQVSLKPVRRRFTADYKISILDQADKCSELGQLGSLLRREGLYSSHLVAWRKQRKEGLIKALSPIKRGRKSDDLSPLVEEVERLRRENQLLRDRLDQAEAIIEVQKKISLLLSSPSPQMARS